MDLSNKRMISNKAKFNAYYKGTVPHHIYPDSFDLAMNRNKAVAAVIVSPAAT